MKIAGLCLVVAAAVAVIVFGFSAATLIGGGVIFGVGIIGGIALN